MHWLNLLALFLGLILFYLLGYWTKKRFATKESSDKMDFGMVENSLLALFAFFLGFTFSISASKIKTVRVSSVEESNAISTALMRSELYGGEKSAKFHDLFRSYLEARIMYFDDQTENIPMTLQLTEEYGEQIWDYAKILFESDEYPNESKLMLPAINNMLDAVATRDSAINSTLPNSIIFTLYALSFCSCFIVGFSMNRKFITNFIGFIYILIITLTVNLILDAGDPRSGFINTKKANSQIKMIYEKL